MEINRVEKGLRDWLQMEARLKELFGNGISGHTYLEKARLNHYREIQKQIGLSAVNEERMMTNILNGEIRLLEKRLFPNRIVRLVRSVGRIYNRTFNKHKSKEELLPIIPVANKIPVNLNPIHSAREKLRMVKVPNPKKLMVVKKRNRPEKSLSIK